MKLNCDMGESFGNWKMGNDAEIMPYVDMANIACGFHASDPLHMLKTVELAAQHDVTIGAHPGYPDLLGFGRREMKFSSTELSSFIIYQVGALQAACRANGTQVSYVKPHGAMYNLMMKDMAVFTAILKGMSRLQSDLPLLVLLSENKQEVEELAGKHAVPLMFEAFCDRAYGDDGNLVPRTEKNSVLETDEDIERRIKELVIDKMVTTSNGKKLAIDADTICVHGDHANALESIKKVRGLINSL